MLHITRGRTFIFNANLDWLVISETLFSCTFYISLSCKKKTKCIKCFLCSDSFPPVTPNSFMQIINSLIS